jgi:FkbM family methyltransferase
MEDLVVVLFFLFSDCQTSFDKNRAPWFTVISQHYFTFPFYIPRVLGLLINWPLYLWNYVCRRRRPAEYILRNGYRLVDSVGTLPGTIAAVFIRREYGALGDARVLLDIGANLGAFAVYAAHACPRARIYCYEPLTENVVSLNRNIAVNSLENRVSVFPYAVAAVSGQRGIAVGESPTHSLVAGATSRTVRTVSCTTLHEILTSQKLETVDVLKMNCEGAEYEIFESCSADDFERIRNIRLEYHDWGDAMRNGDSLAGLLTNHGYVIQRLSRYRGNSGLFRQSGFIWACNRSRMRS